MLTTGDGSITIHIPEWNEQYHSKHGAIAEAQHVFIKTGLHHYLFKEKHNFKIPLVILEIGFGTGLNAFLTLLETKKQSVAINYTGVEAYPISVSEISKLNYASLLGESSAIFQNLHEISWEIPANITQNFRLTKQKKFFSEIEDVEAYHLIYFDAFGARVQPELWTEEIFIIMYKALLPKGVLVTYAAKGSVRRAMQSVGFIVERLPGPPGKREMLRATKSEKK